MWACNCRPSSGRAYVPTSVEHIANIATHAAAIIPALFWFRDLGRIEAEGLARTVFLLYGTALLLLFSMSSIYHAVFFWGKYDLLKLCLHIVDRTTIYFFIAASYTPWLVLRAPGLFGDQMKWLVWIMASIGIVYQYLFHERYKIIEIILYIATGAVPAISVATMEDQSGLTMMKMGGVVYLIGVVFFKSDGIIPCAHAIWHLHVVIGATLHYYAVKIYIADEYLAAGSLLNSQANKTLHLIHEL